MLKVSWAVALCAGIKLLLVGLTARRACTAQCQFPSDQDLLASVTKPAGSRRRQLLQAGVCPRPPSPIALFALEVDVDLFKFEMLPAGARG